MRNLSFLKVFILSLTLLSLTNGLFLPSAGAIVPLEGSFTTTVVSNDQVGHGEIKANVTMQLGDFAGNMPFIDGPNATNSCVARYSYFLGTNQTVIYNCVSPTYTDLATRRTSANFILVDGYARIAPVGGFGLDTFTQRTPTVIASAIAALGTNGDYSLSANGGQITYTRIAPETDPNGSNISPVQLSHGASYLSRVSSRTGYPARPDLYSIVDFIPANVGSGETYEMTIGTLARNTPFEPFFPINTKTYTATGITVAEVTSRIVDAYNNDPSSFGIVCVDSTTKITCSSPNNHNVAVNGSSRVIYSTPDTIAPSVTLNGVNPDTIAYGDTYNDPGANWSDNRDGSGMIFSTSGSINTSAIGTYSLEYTKIDAGGNTGSITRTVNVRDVTAPIVTLLGSGSIIQELDLPYIDAGATWTDDVDGSGSLTASGISLMTATGVYTLTYEKRDVGGNTGTGSREVTIVDTIPPIVSITTNPVTIDAVAYQIRGTATGANTISISGGSGSTVSVIPVNGSFTALVPLIQNNSNVLLVSATDRAGNTGTGSVTITESGSTSGFSGAISVTGSNLVDSVVFSGSGITNTTQVTLQLPVQFPTSSSGTSTIPSGTVIRTSSGGVFDATQISAYLAKIKTVSGSNQVSNGAIEFGISNISLHFSKPIKIEIPLSGSSGNAISVRVRHGGSSTFVTTGLTNNPNATCSNGVATPSSDIATVIGSLATIYTCAASTFEAYTETATVSGGGGGGSGSSSGGGSGGGGGAPLPSSVFPISTPISTSVPNLVSTPILTSPILSRGLYTIVSIPTKIKSNRSFTIEVISTSGSSLTRNTLISVSTVLSEGSRVRITHLREDGKRGVTVTRRVTNGTVSWKTKKFGKYQITKVLK